MGVKIERLAGLCLVFGRAGFADHSQGPVPVLRQWFVDAVAVGLDDVVLVARVIIRS